MGSEIARNTRPEFYFWTCVIMAFERDEYHEFKQSSCCCMGAHICG